MSQPPILLIEDSATYAQLLTHWLETLGYRVETAGTLAAGLALVQQQQYAVIFLDLRLPDAPAELLGGLRQLSVCRQETPILVMTGYATPTMAGEARQIGAALFIDKGDITAATLPQLLAEVLPHD